MVGAKLIRAHEFNLAHCAACCLLGGVVVSFLRAVPRTASEGRSKGQPRALGHSDASVRVRNGLRPQTGHVGIDHGVVAITAGACNGITGDLA